MCDNFLETKVETKVEIKVPKGDEKFADDVEAAQARGSWNSGTRPSRTGGIQNVVQSKYSLRLKWKTV